METDDGLMRSTEHVLIMIVLFINLLFRMETDDGMMQKYHQNMDSRTGTRGPCDDRCRNRAMCTAKHTAYYRRRQDDSC